MKDILPDDDVKELLGHFLANNPRCGSVRGKDIRDSGMTGKLSNHYVLVCAERMHMDYVESAYSLSEEGTHPKWEEQLVIPGEVIAGVSQIVDIHTICPVRC